MLPEGQVLFMVLEKVPRTILLRKSGALQSFPSKPFTAMAARAALPAKVVAVIDLGLHRRVDHDATKGVASLATKWCGAQVKNDTSHWPFWWFVATVDRKVDSDRFGPKQSV